MQPTINTNQRHWKDAALEKAEVITDSWEVVKAYAGRAAEWVLFLCMVINIVEMLPGVTIAPWVLNLVLGVQVVMLDIGGMSLASMAEHARERGAIQQAKKADVTSKFLIGLMITTLLLVAAGVLFPVIKQYTDMAEKGLILVRVVMTVIYGHVIHSLRSTRPQHTAVPTPPAVPDGAELETIVRNILVPILQQYHTGNKLAMADQIKQALAEFKPQKPEEAHKEEATASQKKSVAQSPAPVPIAAMRQNARLNASREARLLTAYRELAQEGVKPTGDTLSRRARCNRAAALDWLKTKQMTG